MEETTYAYLRRKLLDLVGMDLDYYKGKQMYRRLDAWLTRSNCSDWPEYYRRLEQDAAELKRFRDYLTINVSEFFRDPEKFAYLKTHILPQMVSNCPMLNGWSAGSSYGAEAYSLAILMEECFPGRRYRFLGTDIDRTILERAKRADAYSQEDVKHVPPNLLKKYFLFQENRYQVSERIKAKVEFKLHDLLRDPVERGFDLILCRNVVIYFTEEAKELLYRKFHQALKDGGILFVGATEIISRAREIGFTHLANCFYRKETRR
ncbi:MAG: protein-glutamate O-methyltransferase CheR [Candidatus Tectomicrobia bacterium]|uniref:protein-glutamate O-methyltransferase n=1 Tax=Tectimicrobiota bacterium TaxID=2528274 RepID=A0A932FVH4_UNCTE|nr:protein-glutamate O-methyltransferase CheR [Candidatus Tectomicrobia bacterium]